MSNFEKFKGQLHEIAITTYVYLFEYYQKTKTLCCSVPISGSRFANYEPFLRFHEPLFEEFQKNHKSKERHFLTFVARFLMPL